MSLASLHCTFEFGRSSNETLLVIQKYLQICLFDNTFFLVSYKFTNLLNGVVVPPFLCLAVSNFFGGCGFFFIFLLSLLLC